MQGWKGEARLEQLHGRAPGAGLGALASAACAEAQAHLSRLVRYAGVRGKQASPSCSRGWPHRVNVNAQRVHARVAHFVVRRVYQDLVKDLVQARHIGHVTEHQRGAIMHPQLLLLRLGAANVGVRAQKDVVQLRQLLVRVLDRLLAAGAALRIQLRGLQRLCTGLGALRLRGRLRRATTRTQQACRCAEIAPLPAAPCSARSCAVSTVV